MKQGAPLPENRYGYPDDVHTPEQLTTFIDELWAMHKRVTPGRLRYLSVIDAALHMEKHFILGNSSDDELSLHNFRAVLGWLAPWAIPLVQDELLLKVIRGLTPERPLGWPEGDEKRVKRTIFWALASELVEAAGCGKHTWRSLETEWSEWNG